MNITVYSINAVKSPLLILPKQKNSPPDTSTARYMKSVMKVIPE